MESLLTFEEVLEMTKTQNRILLLGNGFSMAYDYNRFSFTSLYKSAIEEGIIEKGSEINQIFDKFSTADFEYIIKVIESSSKVSEVYNVNSEKIEKMKKHTNDLKEYLVDVITNNHPEKANVISDSEYDNTIDNFIKYFDEVYTLNYDLLLYWLTMRIKEREEESSIKNCNLNINDGFSHINSPSDDIVIWQDTTYSYFNQKIFYLHGALHIFDDKYQIIKNVYNEDDKITLREQTLINLKNEKYPIFISEGTSEQKLAKITHNAYLNQSYKKFKSYDGALIIFGTSLKQNDDHILNAIINNKGKNKQQELKSKLIFIGVSSIEKASELDFLKEKLSEQGRRVLFYDYKSVSIWNK